MKLSAGEIAHELWSCGVCSLLAPQSGRIISNRPPVLQYQGYEVRISVAALRILLNAVDGKGWPR